MTWHLAVSAPGAERLVSARMEREELPHHYFKIMDRCVRRGRVITRAVALFPRYLFIWGGGYACGIARGIYGVVAIVPGTVPQIEVDKLLLRAAGGDTLVPPPKVVEERFLPGERVRVAEGPYRGFDAIWHCRTSDQRVRVLLGMMGRQVPIDMEDKWLEAAQPKLTKIYKYRPRRRHREEMATVHSL